MIDRAAVKMDVIFERLVATLDIAPNMHAQKNKIFIT